MPAITSAIAVYGFPHLAESVLAGRWPAGRNPGAPVTDPAVMARRPARKVTKGIIGALDGGECA